MTNLPAASPCGNAVLDCLISVRRRLGDAFQARAFALRVEPSCTVSPAVAASIAIAGVFRAAAKRLRMLAMQAPLAGFPRRMGETDTPTIPRRHAGWLPELRPLILDGDRLLIDAEALNAWVLAKADEYHGKGSGYTQMMNAGRVDGYWTVAAELQQMIRDAQ